MQQMLPGFVRQLARPFRQWETIKRGYSFSFEDATSHPSDPSISAPNALRQFCDNRKEGPGIWKWEHYFDIYDRHLNRFRGQEAHILEIGIYSGGSLDMWRDYFGPKAKISGVDIEPACRTYEKNGVKVFIGDQADRSFWRQTLQEAPGIDIVIDDGGHEAEQQIVSLEELLPKMNPGGVYICEDVHGSFNRFAAYVHGINQQLHTFDGGFKPENGGYLNSKVGPIQSAIASVHVYPFVIVIEKTRHPVREFNSPRRGTEWQPFFD